MFTLALLPIETVEPSFEILAAQMVHALSRNNQVISLDGKMFMAYFRDTYLYGDYPPPLWNHFKTKNEQTNNRLEGDNLKKNYCCGAADPDMDKTVSLLKRYETTASLKYCSA